MRILVADDHDVVRAGVRSILEDRDGWEVVAEAANGKEVPKVQYTVGEEVKINDGPFANLNGRIDEIDPDRGKLKISVSIFGRFTPVGFGHHHHRRHRFEFGESQELIQRYQPRRRIAERGDGDDRRHRGGGRRGAWLLRKAMLCGCAEIIRFPTPYFR